MGNNGVIKGLKIGNLLAKIPIVQGGMGVGISMSKLATAVANENGIGIIATAGIGAFEPDFFTNFEEANIRALKKEIRKAKKITKNILGVNIMVAMSNFENMVKTALKEKIDIIFAGAGLPLNMPKFLNKNMHTKLVPIVSSGKAFRIICKIWKKKYNYLPDAVVVEGPKAGGHLGFKTENIRNPKYCLENLVTEVIHEAEKIEKLEKKTIPVIAAGGIYSGKDIYKFLLLGAAGVQMGTRFVATNECDASDKYKQSYIEAKKKDITIIKSPVGMPGRAIKNKFIFDVEKGKRKMLKCPYHCIVTCDYKNTPYCIMIALINAQKGNLKNGLIFVGKNVHKVKKIFSVKKLMKSLVNEIIIASKE